jgi:uncharacterized protein YdaU (DUF1376 family)
MSKTPFMQFWVADFLGDTLDLDAAEVGAYLLLLMAQWQRDGSSLPNDPVKLQRVARCGRNWPKVWASIGRYFSQDDDGIFNKRLRLEAQNVAAKREVNAHNGSRGGAAKALKTKDAALANAANSLQRNASIPEPEPERVDSEAKASDGEAVDLAKDLFDRAVAFLGRSGVKETSARSMVGRWRRDHADAELLSAFTECSRAGATDPIPWITARLNKPAPFRVSFDLSKFEGMQ